MKAIDYFEKYKPKIDTDEGMKELFRELSGEVIPLIEARHASTDEAVWAVIKEINQKWNAVIRFFLRNNCQCRLKTDGFINLWREEIKGQ